MISLKNVETGLNQN